MSADVHLRGEQVPQLWQGGQVALEGSMVDDANQRDIGQLRELRLDQLYCLVMPMMECRTCLTKILNKI